MRQEVSIFCAPLSEDHGVRMLLCNLKVAKYRKKLILSLNGCTQWLTRAAGANVEPGTEVTLSFPVSLLFCFTRKQVIKNYWHL